MQCTPHNEPPSRSRQVRPPSAGRPAFQSQARGSVQPGLESGGLHQRGVARSRWGCNSKSQITTATGCGAHRQLQQLSDDARGHRSLLLPQTASATPAIAFSAHLKPRAPTSSSLPSVCGAPLQQTSQRAASSAHPPRHGNFQLGHPSRWGRAWGKRPGVGCVGEGGRHACFQALGHLHMASGGPVRAGDRLGTGWPAYTACLGRSRRYRRRRRQQETVNDSPPAARRPLHAVHCTLRAASVPTNVPTNPRLNVCSAPNGSGRPRAPCRPPWPAPRPS